MYSLSLSTHHCICVLHCSKQCYSSSILRPFTSCAIFAFTSSTDGKCVPFSTLFILGKRKSQSAKSANKEDGQVLECVYWEETWAGALSWCNIQTLFFQRFSRFFHKVCHTASLLIPTMSTIILTLRRRCLRTIWLISWVFWLIFAVEGWPGW